jgi:hypothetical protein
MASKKAKDHEDDKKLDLAVKIKNEHDPNCIFFDPRPKCTACGMWTSWHSCTYIWGLTEEMLKNEETESLISVTDQNKFLLWLEEAEYKAAEMGVVSNVSEREIQSFQDMVKEYEPEFENNYYGQNEADIDLNKQSVLKGYSGKKLAFYCPSY